MTGLGVEGVADWRPPSAQLLADLRQLAATLVEKEAEKRGNKARHITLETAKAGGDKTVKKQAGDALSEAQRAFLAQYSGRVDDFAAKVGRAVSYYQASQGFRTQQPETGKPIEKGAVTAALRQLGATLASLEQQLNTMPREALRLIERAGDSPLTFTPSSHFYIGQPLVEQIGHNDPLALVFTLRSMAFKAEAEAEQIPHKQTDIHRLVLAREIAAAMRTQLGIAPSATTAGPFRQVLELCLHHADPAPIPPTESLAKQAIN